MDRELKKILWKKKWMKIKYMVACCSGRGHYEYVKKHDLFSELGENVLYQPNTLPNEPKCIKIHNNIQIASGVIFYTHDVINNVLSHIDDIPYRTHGTCIEIFDNVFIGGNSIIVGNVSIGPNAIIGAGSVVTKDVPEGVIVAGNPARVIGSFEKLHQSRKEEDGYKEMCDTNGRSKELWKKFYENRKNRRQKSQ